MEILYSTFKSNPKTEIPTKLVAFYASPPPPDLPRMKYNYNTLNYVTIEDASDVIRGFAGEMPTTASCFLQLHALSTIILASTVYLGSRSETTPNIFSTAS